MAVGVEVPRRTRAQHSETLENMMSWLSQNWFFVLLALLFVGMHMGHGSHGGHAGHGIVNRSQDRDDKRGAPPPDTTDADRPDGHHH